MEGSEERLWYDGDWGTKVTYRAQSPSGAFADGDGACMVSEKHGKSGTVHNVRSHAHTRAFNRAVSNLVGFGEVSADELTNGQAASSERIRPPQPPTYQRRTQSSPQPAPASTNGTSDKAAKPKTVVGEIDTVDCKSGETNGKPWELFIVNLRDGTSASTFEADVADFAESCRNRGVTVEMHCTPKPMRPSDKYQNWTLVKLDETRETPNSKNDQELTVDDVPF